MGHQVAEQYDTKSNVKLGWFRSQRESSNVSSHTEELWYNETVCLWMTIYNKCMCESFFHHQPAYRT